jgi:peptidoglycan/xylan/chitin deacetylase (PgdA/CDA1 family)
MLPAGMVTRGGIDDVVVLLYHRIGDAPSEIEVPTDLFDRQLHRLSASHRVITLDEALTGQRGGIVVTFDDGYRDFHDVVVPLLAKHRVPALLYLATGLIAHGAPGASTSSLTWSHLREAIATGLVSVGSHTHDHANLAKATESEAEIQMRRSKDLVEEHLGIECRHFAYPWSVASSDAQRAARGLFRSAALDAWKTNRAGRVDPYRLGRVPILRSDGLFFFERKVRGELDSERYAYRALKRGPWGKMS